MVNQARFVRGFLAVARREKFDANVIEAFDQHWKYQSEGTVGANWGLWTAARREKFPLTGPVVADPDWPEEAALSCLFGVGLLLGALSGAPMRAGVQARLAVLAMSWRGALGWAVAGTLADVFDFPSGVAARATSRGRRCSRCC